METVHKNIPQETQEARNGQRDRIEMLRSRVGLLAGKDRLLMTMYLENGNSFRQMARLAGVDETSIAKKIRKIAKRLIDGEYITCLRNRSRFSPAEMDVARDYFLTRLSIRKIAEKRDTTYYGVRKILKKIEGLIAYSGQVKSFKF